MGEAALTSLTWTLLFFCFLGFTSGEVEVKAKPGETVTLPCKAPNKNSISKVVEWSRPGRGTQCAFLYRAERIDADSQNPIFKNRVDLQDKQMKDGNVSLILKNVTINDTGTYECHFQREDDSVELICIIYLRVVAPPGPTGGTTEDGGKEDARKEDGGKEDARKEDGGSVGLITGLIVGLIVGLSVSAVLLVGGVLIYRKTAKSGSMSPLSQTAACVKHLRAFSK